MIYLLVFFSLAAFSLAEFCGWKDLCVAEKVPLDKIAFVFLAFIMFYLAVFRFETGRDWGVYLSFFETCDLQKNSSPFEAGFSFLNRFFKIIFDNFYVMQFCIMVFCCLCVYRSFYKRSEFPVFTLFLYFIMFFLQTDMAQTRQHLAMSILLCGMPFVHKRKFFCWCLVVLLAMQFHITAFMAFPLYFTTYRKTSVATCASLFLICVFVTFFGLSVIRTMLSIVVNISFAPERIRVIGNLYLNSTIFGQQGQFNTGLGFIARYLFIALMIFFYALERKRNLKYKNFYFLNFFIALIFQAMGRNFDQFGRIANYYLICGGGVCAYNLLVDCKSFFKKTDVARFGMCTVFLLLMSCTFFNMWYTTPKFFNSYHDDYTPYKSVLFQDGYILTGIVLVAVMFMFLIFCGFYMLRIKQNKILRQM